MGATVENKLSEIEKNHRKLEEKLILSTNMTDHRLSASNQTATDQTNAD